MNISSPQRFSHLGPLLVGVSYHFKENWFSMGVFSWLRTYILRIWGDLNSAGVLVGFPVRRVDGVSLMGSILGVRDILLALLVVYCKISDPIPL